jgi:hypothetical protein
MATNKLASFVGKPVRPQTSTYRAKGVTKDLNLTETDVPTSLDFEALRINQETKLSELAHLSKDAKARQLHQDLVMNAGIQHS